MGARVEHDLLIASQRFIGADRRCNLETMGNGAVSESPALIRLTSPSATTGLNLSCRWTRFAFVSLRPVVLDLGV
jgi:hypothetical protein